VWLTPRRLAEVIGAIVGGLLLVGAVVWFFEREPREPVLEEVAAADPAPPSGSSPEPEPEPDRDPRSVPRPTPAGDAAAAVDVSVGDDLGWEASVVVEVPDGAFAAGTAVTVSASSAEGGPLAAARPRSPGFSIDAGGVQPAVALVVSVPGDMLADHEPEVVFLARWDPEVEVWVPVPTRFDSATGRFVAEVDHLSIFRFWEWQIWEDVQRGVQLSARQVADLFDRTSTSVNGFAQRIGEGFGALGQTAVGWLKIGGANPPVCEEGSTGFDLAESDSGEKRALHACQQPGSTADQVVVKVANNRPYGMVVERPRNALARLESWPGIAIDSGQAALYTFYDLLDSQLGVGQFYLPPGATVSITLNLAGIERQRIEATSTPALTGFDLAAELLWSIWLTTPELGLEGVNCLLVGGSSLLDLVESFGPEQTGAFLHGVRVCLEGLGIELGGDVYAIGRFTLATVPALISNIRDTDFTRFEVANHFELLRHQPEPAEPARELTTEELADQIGCADPCSVSSAVTLEHPDHGQGWLVLLSGVTIPESGAVAFVADGTVHWWRDLIGFPDGFGIEVDALGHAFFSTSPGSRRSDLIVLVPTAGGFDDFGSLDGRFSSGSIYTGGYAADLLGNDGIYEIVVTSNDCTPSCGDGTETEFIHRWDGSDYTIVD
jgi:hypothetical protein